MALEVELKFRAADGAPLDALTAASRLGAATLGPAVGVDEVDRYLDSDDGRLATARWACRLRTRDGVTRLSMKGPPEPRPAMAALHRRPEVEGPATDDLDPERWPDSAARQLLDDLRAGRPLRERFRLLQRRTEREVTLEGAPLGTLSLDRVEVEAGGERLGKLHAVELELSADAARAVDASRIESLAAALGVIDGLEAEERTKLEHALALIGRP